MGQGDRQAGERRPTDYRALAQRNERSIVVTAVLLLIVGGSALIGVFFGWGAILTALPFLILGGAGIVGAYVLWLWLERWANR